jgi:hypothetical protein
MALPAGFAQPQSSDNGSNYVFCVLKDNVDSVVYFSDVFPGDSSRNDRYVDTFHDYLHKIAPRIYGTPECFYTEGTYTARQRKDTMVDHYRKAYRELTDTGWTD